MPLLTIHANKCFLHIAVAVFVAFSSVGASSKNDLSYAGYALDELVDLYVQLTFRLEGSGANRELRGLTKWRDNIAVKVYTIPRDSIFDNKDPEFFRKVINLVARISAEISQPLKKDLITWFNADQMSSLVNQSGGMGPQHYENSISVYVSSRSEIRNDVKKLAEIVPSSTRIFEAHLAGAVRTNSPLCFGVAVSLPNTPVLTRAWVFIENSPSLENCVFEELMQTFGLFNDFPTGTPSMFNDDNKFSRPTELDWLLWRVHFDERLKPGMSEEQVRKAAPNVISDLVSGTGR